MIWKLVRYVLNKLADSGRFEREIRQHCRKSSLEARNTLHH
jgi:hypothetical protein